jgi:transposase
MPKIYQIKLSERQRQELEVARNSHAFAYVRERAAGILKVDRGNSLRQVAYVGLLRRHAPETVKEWCERYLAEGLAGLRVREGRGRKPCFFPSK